jgi:hypothetical protein
VQSRIDITTIARESPSPASLRMTRKRRQALRGDSGAICGNESGTRNAGRHLWSDQSPEVSINNDIPSEIRIHPNQ